MNAVQDEKLLVRKEGALGWIIINQPEKRNAFSFEMWQGLPGVIAALEADPEIRVILLRGAGKEAFCAGADISEFAQVRSDPESCRRYDAVGEAALAALRNAALIVIAVIDGHCVGGGAGIALDCDILIAAESARFAVTPARLGLAYPLADIERMVATLGPKRTTEILATGRSFSAREAHAMGWVNEVVPAAALEARATEVAAMIAANAPLSVKAVKALVREAMKPPGARDLAACARLISACDQSADFREGQQAFAEKRPQKFEGR